MAARAHIPLVFHVTDQAALKRDLERFAHGVQDYVHDAQDAFVAAPKPATRSGILAFGMVARVALAPGATLVLQLPRPDIANANKMLAVVRETTPGTCTIRGVGCLVNGRPSKVLPAARGVYQFFFDGTNYFSDTPLAVDWGG